MSKRGYVRIISFTALGLAIVIGVLVVNTRNMTRYKNQLELNYQQSLIELDECLEKVNTDLTKCIYSNSSGEIYDLSRDLYSQCATAKNAVSRLPISQMELRNVYKFLSQASDYAQFIGSKIQNNQPISEKEHKVLLSLLNYAQKFSTATGEMVNIVEGGARIVEGEVAGTKEINVSSLSNGFSTSATTFKDFPTLLYDGPFSDQVLNKKSQMVKNADVKSKNECMIIASNVLGINKVKLNFEADEQSKIPCYTFKYGRQAISITKQGGFVKSILYSGIINDATIDEKEAVKFATQFLTKIGYPNMKESYYSTENNVCTINFAYCENGVYYYSDLIKCSVSLYDGKVISLDAQTYLTNHVERNKFKPTKTVEECAKQISPYLTINNIKYCVIPKENGSEVECYEFTCTSNDTGEDALIYINTKTAEEEDIMLLLYTDNGTLVK